MKIMNVSSFGIISAAGFAGLLHSDYKGDEKKISPNIIIIYADDLGYGDLSCYGASSVKTPNIDRLAGQGLRFTNAYCTSATSTPSRYSLLTGEYAWRRKGTGIATGDAPAIIKPGRETIATAFKRAGYTTGVVGKWHLGLGSEGGADWNGTIEYGPPDIGFDYNFIIPATGDRVPCVFVENREVVNLDHNDPIKVSFSQPILTEPTGRDHPELLKIHPSHGHDMTIVNGISRIGYMSGGKAALWTDEKIAEVITGKAVRFIEENRKAPFFLYFATHDIHVPRVPSPHFAGKSPMGPRGDVILEFDWSVGQITEAVRRLGLSDNTIIIVTSDNGPVVDDGYRDEAVEKLGSHTPAGPLRGGKYSLFEGGTRIPFIVGWKGSIKPGTSNALFSQIDLFASLTALAGQTLVKGSAPDSYDYHNVLLGKTDKGRDWIIEHAGRLSVIRGDWKFIEPGPGERIMTNTNTETGNDTLPQLYNIKNDIAERKNLASENPLLAKELNDLLQQIKHHEISDGKN